MIQKKQQLLFRHEDEKPFGVMLKNMFGNQTKLRKKLTNFSTKKKRKFFKTVLP